jgi:hypothetical protein
MFRHGNYITLSVKAKDREEETRGPSLTRQSEIGKKTNNNENIIL